MSTLTRATMQQAYGTWEFVWAGSKPSFDTIWAQTKSEAKGACSSVAIKAIFDRYVAVEYPEQSATDRPAPSPTTAPPPEPPPSESTFPTSSRRFDPARPAKNDPSPPQPAAARSEQKEPSQKLSAAPSAEPEAKSPQATKKESTNPFGWILSIFAAISALFQGIFR